MVTKAMNKWFYFAFLVIVLTACSMQSDTERFIATDPETYTLGEQVYTQNCLACHGVNGVGQNPENPRALDATGRYVAPPHNDNGHTWHHDDDLLFGYIHDGGMGDPSMFNLMPAFGASLSDEQITAVIFYIKSLWTEEHRQFQREATERARNP